MDISSRETTNNVKTQLDFYAFDWHCPVISHLLVTFFAVVSVGSFKQVSFHKSIQ